MGWALRAMTMLLLFTSFAHNVRLVRRPLALEEFSSVEKGEQFFWLCLTDCVASLAGFLIVAWLWGRFRWHRGVFMLVVTQVLTGTSMTQLVKFAFAPGQKRVWYATWLSLWLKGGSLLAARFSHARFV